MNLQLLVNTSEKKFVVIASLFLMFSWNTTLEDGLYYWAVAAFNGLSGPISYSSSFVVCLAILPTFFNLCFTNVILSVLRN